MRLRILAASFCLVSASWASQTFTIDPAWSHVEFNVQNMAINTVEGRFTVFSGTITVEEADITRSAANVSIQTASVDTGIKKRDNHLRAADFFESARYPEMTFKSSRIEKKDKGYVLIGPLTIKGRTKDVELPFTYSVEKSSAGVTTLRGQAQGRINRHDYGIDYGSNFSVGKEVQIILHIQAVP